MSNPNASKLRDLQPRSIGLGRKTKTIGTDYRSTVENRSLTDDALVVDRHMGIE
jgi:hypothetical protein